MAAGECPFRASCAARASGLTSAHFLTGTPSDPPSQLHVGVEPVAQRVAHQVDGQGGHEDREAGEGGDPPRVEHVDASLAEHVAPGRRRRLHAQAQERQERFQDDHAGHLQRGDDDDHRDEVRQDLAEDEARVAHVERAAARMNSRSRMASVSARMTRAYSGQSAMPSTMIMLTRLGPSTAMTARASSTKGNVSMTLTSVMMVQSMRPAK